LEHAGFRDGERVVLRVKHRRLLDAGPQLQRLLERLGRHHAHWGRHAADERAELRDALHRVGGRDHRHLGALRQRIGREGLLRQGGADNAQHPGVDEALEGLHRPGLAAAGILQHQADGRAVHAALGVEVGLGHLRAVDLLLAEERHVAGGGNGDAHGQRLGHGLAGRRPCLRGRGCTKNNKSQQQRQAKNDSLHAILQKLCSA